MVNCKSRMALQSQLRFRITSLADTAHNTAKAIGKIIALPRCPDFLAQINNEVTGLRILLRVSSTPAHVFDTSNERAVRRIQYLLEETEKQLNDLRQIIRGLVADSESGSERPDFQWTKWYGVVKRLQRLTACLSESQQNLAAVFPALSPLDMLRPQVSLRKITLIRKGDTAMHVMGPADTRRSQSPPNSLIPAKIWMDEMPEVTHELHDIFTGASLMPLDVHASDNDTTSQGGSLYEVKSIVQDSGTHMDRCRCPCHASLSFNTPRWLESAIGSLLLSWNQKSFQLCKICDGRPCQRGDQQTFQTRYYFPVWVLHRMMSMRFDWSLSKGPIVSLMAPRCISPNSKLFMLAQHGNIVGIQKLFDEKLASPFDISLEEGRSALHFAATAEQPAMVAFLIKQGADPQLEDRNMLSTHDVVWNYFLQMPGKAELENLLCSAGLSPGNIDSLEKRSFTPLHRIVLELSSLDLDEYLTMVPGDIDKRDSFGKTALCWAASRPNTNTTRVLLNHGASLYLADRRLQTPLHYCAGSGSAESIKLLLEISVQRNQLHTSSSKGSSSDVTLVDHNNQLDSVVDARDVKGRTPLNFATRMDFPAHAELLITHGANMETTDTRLNRTILLWAVYWNSHKVLPILLAKGARTDVIDARNASLLHYAARFGDIETLRILGRSNLGHLNANAQDKGGLMPLEIVQSSSERCVVEEEPVRLEAISIFQRILGDISRETRAPQTQDDVEFGYSGLQPRMDWHGWA